MIPSFPRIFRSAWTHRAAAFLAVAVGGGLVGSTVRRLTSSESEFGLLGQTYLAGWLWRSGVSLSVLYDPAALRAAMAQIQPDGPVLSAPWLQPPALALLGWPLTAFSLEGARSVSVFAAVLLLLLGLAGLGWRRAGGYNRTDWLLLAGITLCSQGASLALRDSEPTPVSFALCAWLLVAVETRRRALPAILSFVLAPLSGPVWFVPICLAISGRSREAAHVAVAIFMGIAIAILCFGWAPHLDFMNALARDGAFSRVTAPSLPAQLGALWRTSPAVVTAISVVVLGCGLAMLRRIPSLDHPLWRGLPVSFGLLLGALVLPAALPSRVLLTIPALWTAGRLAVVGEASFPRWIGLLASGALMMFPWPSDVFSFLGVGRGAPVVAGEMGLLVWIWRAASNPQVGRRALEAEAEHPARDRSLRPTQAG